MQMHSQVFGLDDNARATNRADVQLGKKAESTDRDLGRTGPKSDIDQPGHCDVYCPL